jgi:hypothetical protein
MANVFVGENFRPFLGDFGLAKQKYNIEHTSWNRGHTFYQAPEFVVVFFSTLPSSALANTITSSSSPLINWFRLYIPEGRSSHLSDVYSFGLLMFELLGNTYAFFGLTEDEMRNIKMAQECMPIQGVLDDCSAPIISLVERCTARDPAARPPMYRVVWELNEIFSKPGLMNVKHASSSHITWADQYPSLPSTPSTSAESPHPSPYQFSPNASPSRSSYSHHPNQHGRF